MYHQEQNTSRHPTPKGYLQPFGNPGFSCCEKKTQEIRASTLVGTPEYLAPEATPQLRAVSARGVFWPFFLSQIISKVFNLVFVWG